MKLDPKCEAAVERWVAQAPPLSQQQQDTIAAAFRGAFRRPRSPDAAAPDEEPGPTNATCDDAEHQSGTPTRQPAHPERGRR